MLTGSTQLIHNVPVLGFYQSPHQGGGRIVVFGDSNCLDNSHLRRSEFTNCIHTSVGRYQYFTSGIHYTVLQIQNGIRYSTVF